MLTAVKLYPYWLYVSYCIFLVSAISTIVLQEPFLLLIPFVWMLISPVFNYITTRTEHLYWLLFILLPLSTELNITPQLGLDFPDELLLLLLTGICFLKIVHQPKWFPYALSKHPLFMLLVIYLLWIFLSCIYAVEPILSFKYLLAKIWYIVPFVLLPQRILHTRLRIQKMALCLLIPMLFVVMQTLFRHSLHAFSFETVKYILYPFFRNHVNYSSMLVCLLPVGWCVWILTPAENDKRKWVLYGLYIGLAGLLFSYSRGAWIALLAGIAGAWIIRKKMTGPLIATAVLGILISTAWLVTDKNYMRFATDHDHTVFHTDFSEHIRATVNMKDISTAERFYRWIAGIRMLADKPFTGFGPNSFYLHYRPYTVSRFETWVSDNPEHSTVHNYFILTALEQGVVGLLLFCVLYFGMLLHTQKLYHRLQSRFYRMVALTTGIVLIMLGVINCMSDMIETDKIGSLFWLCLGMIVLLETKSKEERSVIA